MDEFTFTRRGSLVRLGGLVAGALGVAGWEAGSSGAGPAGVASGEVSCVLAPEQTEGPYYIPGELVRRNITEGRPTGLWFRMTALVEDEPLGVAQLAATELLAAARGVQADARVVAVDQVER